MTKDTENKKEVADELTRIDIRVLKREGFLKTGQTTSGSITWDKNKIGITILLYGINNKYINLEYTKYYYTGEKREFNYRIEITTTPCYFGGVRYWFHCPLLKDGKMCGRRIAVLYQGRDYFGCRQCYNLCYKSNLERHKITSDYGLYELFEDTRTHYYKGKMTRRYKSYLKKEKATQLYFEAALAKAQKGLARVKRWEACIQKRKRHNGSHNAPL
jgi:hypothetical protein